MPSPWLTVFVGLLFGLYLRKKAKGDGKRPLKWFFIGFVFGLLGLFAYWVAQDLERFKKEKKAPPPAPVKPKILFSDAFWYYLDPHLGQIGPLSYQRISELFEKGEIHLQTYLWNEDLENWEKVEKLLKN